MRNSSLHVYNFRVLPEIIFEIELYVTGCFHSLMNSALLMNNADWKDQFLSLLMSRYTILLVTITNLSYYGNGLSDYLSLLGPYGLKKYNNNEDENILLPHDWCSTNWFYSYVRLEQVTFSPCVRKDSSKWMHLLSPCVLYRNAWTLPSFLLERENSTWLVVGVPV